MPYHELPSPAERPARAVPLGVSEAKLEPEYLDFDEDPHFLVFGERESGKSSVLRTLIRGITEAYTPQQARIVVVDFRRALLGAAPESHQLAYCASLPALMSVLGQVSPVLDKRRPGEDVTAQQLRTRSWWTGVELFIVVDDYELVAESDPVANPLAPILTHLSTARDLGLHLVIARASAGAGRALFEPVIQRLRESRQPGLILSGDRNDGPLLGQVRPSLQPPGRGTLVSRRNGALLTQAAFSPPPD